MNVAQLIRFFQDFYADFDTARAYDMLHRLNLDPMQKLKTMSKGTKEKVQLILVMSRRAQLYLLDEPIGGVDPAARDFILHTIITNYNQEGHGAYLDPPDCRCGKCSGRRDFHQRGNHCAERFR